MSDDEAFLATIAASPDDDVPRLVYADWLEEHNVPEKAEYLRLVNQLTVPSGDTPRTANLVKRLLTLADQIDEAWRNAAGRRFDVIIEGWLGSAMFVFMKAVHWMTGASSVGAMESNEAAKTVTLRRQVRREEAEAYVSSLDKNRFDKNRETKPFCRIVPAAAASALGDTPRNV